MHPPMCAIRIFRENGQFYFEPYRTFYDREEMDLLHDEIESDGSPDGELITFMNAPWTKVKEFYAVMYLLIAQDPSDYGKLEDYTIIDCFRSINNVVRYLIQQVFGILACDESDFDEFRNGAPIFSGYVHHMHKPLKEKTDDCDEVYKWVQASPKTI